MGAFFDNIQVFTPEPTGFGDLRIALLDSYSELGWQVACAEEADRTIVLGPPSPRGWTPVYDYGPEPSPKESSETFVQQLSARLHTKIVTVSVHDSDVLDMSLFVDGNHVDHYCNDPAYFLAEEISGPAGNPEAWKKLAGNSGPQVQTFLETWDSRPPFAEEILSGFAECFGWQVPGSLVGYEDLSTAWNSDQLTSLYLKHEVFQERQRNRSRLPILVDNGVFYPPQRVFVGGEARITFYARNTGAESKGIWVVAGGPAVESGLVQPEPLEAWPAGDRRPNDHVARFERFSQSNELTYCARIGDIELPRGVQDDGIPSAKTPGALRKLLSDRKKSEISGVLTAHAAHEGAGEMYVGVYPLRNLESGHFGMKVPIHVIPVPRRPLPSPQDVQPAWLQLLQERRVLFAYLILLGQASPVLDTAAATSADWLSYLATRSDRIFQTTLVRPDGKAKNRKWPIRDLVLPKRWVSFRERLTEAESLGIMMAPTRTPTCNYIRPDKTGMAISIFRDRGDRCLCHVSLWVQAMDSAVPVEPAAISHLEEITEKAFSSGYGVQGFIAFWSFPPSYHDGQTVYESACDIQPEPKSSEWCLSHLRGISDRMWLGSSFVEGMDPSAFDDKVAGIERTDYGARVRLKVGQGLESLERYLLPFLKTSRRDGEKKRGPDGEE